VRWLYRRCGKRAGYFGQHRVKIVPMQQAIRDLAVFSIAGCLIASGTLAGQSKDELRRKYGEPISETFTVRPDVSVTATYETNGPIVELLISPRATEIIKSRGKTLSHDSVKAIIDELVPHSVRGKFVSGAILNVVCLPENDCAGGLESYQKVTIFTTMPQPKGKCIMPSSNGRTDGFLF
jgi:hypothetical protein